MSVCITNDMAHVSHRCTVKGFHTNTCTGFKRSGKECTGCAPRVAKHGLLCWPCWDRLRNVLAKWPSFELALLELKAENANAVTPDGEGSASSKLGFDQVHLVTKTLDECLSFLPGNDLPDGEKLDAWVSSLFGARDAIRFTRVSEAAFDFFELEEKPHALDRTYCPECKMKALSWNPPQFYTDEVRVVCLNCGYEMDQSSHNVLAAIEMEKKK